MVCKKCEVTANKYFQLIETNFICFVITFLYVCWTSSFCSSEPDTLYHFLYLCSFSVDFWRDFEVFWHQLLKDNIRLSLQDILVVMIRPNSSSANLIMIGKLYLWDCRRSQILPNIYRFKKKIALKYETEKYISPMLSLWS